MSRTLFNLYSKNTSLHLIPVQFKETTKKKGSLSFSAIVNFVYIVNTILSLLLYSQNINKSNRIIFNFLFIESSFPLLAISYSLFIRYTENNIVKKSRNNQVHVIKTGFVLISVMIFYKITMKISVFQRIFSVFHPKFEVLHINNSLFINFNKPFMIILFFYLIFNNNYQSSTYFNCLLTCFLCYSAIYDYNSMLKIRILMFSINFLIYFPDLFKFFLKFNKNIGFLQYFMSLMYLIYILYDSLSRVDYNICDVDLWILYFIIFFNLFMVFLYTFLYNTCYYYRKSVIEGKWDEPIITDYY